jgi:multidrug resistance efflux pump
MVTDNDKFKIELRKIEAELKDIEKEVRKCNAALNLEKKEITEMSEVKDLLKKLNERINNLEKKQAEANTPSN